jgi:hypothetical protein
MYTDAMRVAFKSIRPPSGFKVTIVDYDNFLGVRASEIQFLLLPDEDKRRAIEYMVKVKAALESHGAIVQLVREGGEEDFSLERNL